MVMKPKVYQFLIGLFASLGSFLFGYDLGVIAEVVACESFVNGFHPSDNDEGLVVSMFTAGAFCGAFFAGISGDRLGRRKTILLGSCVFILGGAVQTAAKTIRYLWGGRFVAGMGVGLLVMIVPLYQAELSHPSIRGRVTALIQFMLGIGAFCATWIGYGTYKGFGKTDDRQWRVSLGIQIVPAGILGALILLFPESPRWLIDHGRPEQGLKVLAQLHAHGNENDPWVRAEYEQIQEQISVEHDLEAKNLKQLFINRPNFRRLLICTALQASIQMTGVSAIQYYSPAIFKQIGIGTGTTLLLQAINSIIGLLGQLCAVLFIDRLGRRWPLIWGNIGNMITYIIGAILLAVYPAGTAATGAHWGFIITVWVYQFTFSSTCGPLSWIVPAEVFDTATRSKGVAIATMTSFAFNTMIGQVTPVAITHIGWRYYILFIVCNFTNAVFFWAFLPETAKVPLEEMHYLFEKSPWFVPGINMADYRQHDLERREEEIRTKGDALHLENTTSNVQPDKME